MPVSAYTNIIDPHVIQIGDKIRIKGILKDNAEEFSINFVNETCKNPDFITYHFKWILTENVIVQNYKNNGSWIDHQEMDYDSLDGVLYTDPNGATEQYNNNNNNTNLNYSVLGPGFEFEFAFQDREVYVYSVYKNGHNLITTYDTYFEISEIKSLQVWGDVKTISEIRYKYA